MKGKAQNDSRLQRRAQRKHREIKRWEREKARPRTRTYLIYMIFIVCLVYITDEIASQMGALMKTEIANDLMASYGESSVGMLELVNIIAIPFQALSLVYKPLSDRFGRRLFLIVNTAGISAGMLTIALTHSAVGYVTGAIAILFFVPHDMQVVYIMESAPQKHRGKIYSTVKCVATLGVMLVPLLRRLIMTQSSMWREVYLVPAIVGFAASLLALLLARETDAFIDSRLSVLKAAGGEDEKQAPPSRVGLFAALGFASKHRQLRWIFAATAFCNFGVIITMHYQVVMSYGFAESIVAKTGIAMQQALEQASVENVTSALFLFPVGSAAAQLLVGYLADSLGRKKSAVLMTAVTLCSFVLLTLGSRLGWAPWLVGLFCGAAVGGFWGVSDVMLILISESTPTALRSSMLSAVFLATGVGYVVAYAVGLPLITALGNAFVPVITLCLAVPGLAASLLITMTRIHDTTNVDLDTVTGAEWD